MPDPSRNPDIIRGQINALPFVAQNSIKLPGAVALAAVSFLGEHNERLVEAVRSVPEPILENAVRDSDVAEISPGIYALPRDTFLTLLRQAALAGAAQTALEVGRALLEINDLENGYTIPLPE